MKINYYHTKIKKFVLAGDEYILPSTIYLKEEGASVTPQVVIKAVLEQVVGLKPTPKTPKIDSK